MTVTLPYSKEPFGVPKNLYTLGTMNTADRSIALIDIALRRRFTFVELMPNPKMLEGKEVRGVPLDALLQRMNERITALLDRDHQIGHSYFLDVESSEHLRFVWYHRVVPLLQEYFYNDGERLRAVIGKKFLEEITAKMPGDLYDPETPKYEVQKLEGEEFLDALRRLSSQKSSQETSEQESPS